jgi:hypothetical protein
MAIPTLPRTDTRAMAHFGLAVFVPALTLLLDPSITNVIVAYCFPSVPANIVKIIEAFIMAYAGWLLLYAKSPDSPHPDPEPPAKAS